MSNVFPLRRKPAPLPKPRPGDQFRVTRCPCTGQPLTARQQYDLECG